MAVLFAACNGEPEDSDPTDTGPDTDPEPTAQVPLEGAGTSAGGGLVTSGSYRLNVVIGGPLAASSVRSASHQITVGPGTFARGSH
jgi:hypothetical protein